MKDKYEIKEYGNFVLTDDEKKLQDLIIYGYYFTDQNGKRIPPEDVLITRDEEDE